MSGLPPHDGIARRAKELLATEHLPVTEICFEVRTDSKMGEFRWLTVL
jgi:hypothetical protein